MRTLCWVVAIMMFVHLTIDAHRQGKTEKFIVAFTFWWAVLYLID